MKRSAAFAAVLLAFVATAGAAERAWYGFHIHAQTTGFPLNPIIRSITIDKVKPNSPADAQEIRVGDEIIEADGQSVPGTRALQLIGILNKKPGDTLRLVLRRASGDTYPVVIVGIKKPAS
ncbi:MAG TPA: PDZ domain-containing protein [Chthoniobacterales bacterium]